MTAAYLMVAVQLAVLPDPSAPPGLSTEQTITIAAIFCSFLGALIGYFISAWRSKKDTQANNETTLKVAAENAAVAGRTAATQEFAALTQGYQASLTRQDNRITRLEEYIGMQDSDIAALVEHVEKLEELIPNPPGAPERPKLNRRHLELNP